MANDIIKGMGFHHVALTAADFEESIRFYTEGLGMKLYTQWGEGERRIAMLDMGDGGILELFACGSDREAVDPKYTHLALRVDDVDKAFEIALKAGAKPKILPKVVPVDSKPVKITINCGFVYGPSGEEVEFFRFL